MRHYLQLNEVREIPSDEPMLISWYDDGTRYGVCVRIPTMRRDAVKLRMIDISSKTESELVLTEKPHELRRAIIVNQKNTEYQLQIPVTVAEERSCYRVMGMEVPREVSVL